MNNKKAQTLTELATFGSVLLLVLSFFVNYGMRDNHQQDSQMRSFRMAMAVAYNNTNPDASSSLVLLEDKHIPDPRDSSGVGNLVPAQASAQVTWGNTLQNQYDVTNSTLLPQMEYNINGTALDYTTQGYGFITNAKRQDGTYTPFYAILPGNTIPQLIPWDTLHSYQPTSNSPIQAMVSLNADGTLNKDGNGTETEIISEVYLVLTSTGTIVTAGTSTNLPYIKCQVIKAYPDTDGVHIYRLDLLSPALRSGSNAVNPNYLITQLGADTGNVDSAGNPIYVTPDTVQGLLFDNTAQIQRNDTLTLTEDPTSYTSNTNSNVATTVTRKIKDNYTNIYIVGSTLPGGSINLQWKTTK